MKFKINSQLLKDVLKAISGGLGSLTIGARSIKIIAENDTLTLMTNNIRLAYKSTIPATVEQNGNVLVDGNFFINLISAARESEISVFTDEHHLHIRDGRRKSSLGLVVTDDFIDTFVVEEHIATIDGAEVLQHILKGASITVAPNDSPYSGICMDNNYVVSTDGVKATIIPFKNNAKNPIIFSKESVIEIAKFNFNDKVELYGNESFLTIILGDADNQLIFTCQLLETTFPPVIERLLERLKYQNYVSINCEEFNRELTYISLVSDNKEQLVNMIIENGSVKLSADAYMGTNRINTELTYDVLNSEQVNGLNFKFKVGSLLSLMKVIKETVEEEYFTLFYNDGDTAIKIVCGQLILFLTNIKDV